VSIYVPSPPAAKAFIGPGAAAMMTQPARVGVTQTPQGFMRAAAGFWKTDPWIRAAERVISGKFSTVEWHLENADDVEVDDEYPNPAYFVPRDLLEQPQAKLPPESRQVNASTRRELWAITSRHMGVCGSAFWYFDQMEPTTKTPLSILYIAPWRMWPSFTKAGQLTGWVLDYNDETKTGTPLTLDEVLQFNIEPPDEGAFPPGLVQSAMGIVSLDGKVFGHASDVLTAGGRLAGIVSPKTADASLPDDKFQQLVRDFRTINEMPDAARRTNILQGPVDFNRTAATLGELELIALMSAMRDDILALWGVPYSQLGGSIGTGLNSGDVRKYDEAALWQNAIHQRLVPFAEGVQYGLLDRYKSANVTVELEIEEPEFDDDGPRFDLLAKSAGIAMDNDERRDLISLPPLDPSILGASGKPLGKEVWLPTTLAVVTDVPADVPPTPPSSAQVERVSPDAQVAPAAIARTPMSPASMGKATLHPKAAKLHASLTRLRARIDKEHTPELKAALSAFLASQRQDIATRLRMNSAHIAAKPRDFETWFAKKRWDRELTSILARPLTAMAQNVNAHIAELPVKATPAGVVDRALSRGAARVVGINEKTRKAVQDYIVAGLEKGQSPTDLADDIETGVLLGNGQPAFDELRAETIARTELMDAYNGAALASYSDLGATEVQAIDGDGDEECADRDGKVFSVEEADGIEDHPNGTLDWVPVIPDDIPEAKAVLPSVVINNPGPLVRTVIERDADGRIVGSYQVAL
jgi:hypothetical protein